MKTICTPTSAKQLKGRNENGSQSMEHPLQRIADQWSLEQKQLLIDTMLRGMIVPPVYVQKIYTDIPDPKHLGRFKSVDLVIDGKQRLTTTFAYMNDMFPFSEDADPVEVDDETFEIAGKKFSELPMEVQYAIKEFRFSVYVIEDATDDEIEECISRLNSGTPFTKTQKAKTIIGLDIATMLNDLSKRKFFTDLCAFSSAQKKGEQEKCTIIQTMMILDFMNDEYALKTISEADVLQYSKEIKGNYSEDKKAAFASYIDYLEDALDKKCRFLKKVNIPMVIYMAKIALEKEIDAERFGKWLVQFGESDVPGGEYSQYRSAGSVKKANVLGRIETMQKDFEWYFNLSDETEE